MFLVLQTKISGCIPDSNKVLTECCVGFVFSSPAADKKGTRVRCINSVLSSNSQFNCLTDSM